jgi:hypothetical protein
MSVELAIGMKVMVTTNLATDLDIANGAHGEIVDIVLHPDEPPINEEAIVTLKFLPVYILVKLSHTKASQLDGLDESVVPVEPTSIKHRISVSIRNKTVHRTVLHRQCPVTAAYAFTDYRSQGQTIPYVLIDIGTPPFGTLSLFNLYVALFCCSGCGTIHILWDFDDELFKKPHDMALLEEDDRLDRLDKTTNQAYIRMTESVVDTV